MTLVRFRRSPLGDVYRNTLERLASLTKGIRVTRDSIYCWIDRKVLPSHSVRRLWKFQLSDVGVWLRAGDVK